MAEDVDVLVNTLLVAFGADGHGGGDWLYPGLDPDPHQYSRPSTGWNG